HCWSLVTPIKNPRLATNVMRLAERSWLIPALQEVLSAIPQDEIVRRCERANVSWAPVGQPGDLFTDEHLLATGGLVDVFISRFGEPGGKIAGLPALPIEFGTDRRRPGIRRQPPRIGEHNTELLSERGFPPGESSDPRKPGGSLGPAGRLDGLAPVRLPARPSAGNP